MIIVTHEMSFAHQISDKVIFMDQGQIVESSTAKQIFDHPQMSRTQQFLARYRAIITKKDNTEITKMSDIKGHKFSQTGHGLSMTFMHL